MIKTYPLKKSVDLLQQDSVDFVEFKFSFFYVVFTLEF